MKWNKLVVSDEIVIEMLTALYNLGANKVTKVLNEIYESSEILEELSRSIFMLLPRNQVQRKTNFIGQSA